MSSLNELTGPTNVQRPALQSNRATHHVARDAAPGANAPLNQSSNHVAVQSSGNPANDSPTSANDLIGRSISGGERGADDVASYVVQSVGALPSLPEEPRHAPLPSAWRRSLEPLLAADLSSVRIHADEGAARLAQAEGAKAYALGESIVFGRGQLRPGTREGVDLIAHELAHVVQQRATGPCVQRRDIGGISSVDATTEPMDAPRVAPGFSMQGVLFFCGVELAEDKKQVKAALADTFLAQPAGGIKAAWDFRNSLSRETFSVAPKYVVMHGDPEVSDNVFARRVERMVQESILELQREDAMFVDAFASDARLVLAVMMDQSKIALAYYRGRFASSGEDNRVYEVAAQKLQANSNALMRDKLRIENEAGGVAWGGDLARAGSIRAAIPTRIRAHHDEREHILTSAPWLRGINYGNLGVIAGGDFAPIVDVIDAKIKACDAVKTSRADDVWMNPTVVQATLDLRRILYDSRWAHAVDSRWAHAVGSRIHSQQRASEAWRLGLSVVQMVCYLAAPFTGGASLLPAAAISLFQVGGAAIDYSRGSSLHQAGLAPAPSSLGLALSIAGAVLDVGAAAAPAKKLLIESAKTPVIHAPHVEPIKTHGLDAKLVKLPADRAGAPSMDSQSLCGCSAPRPAARVQAFGVRPAPAS
ncbi:hypothetical protein BH09MYX1_BH09MYX1_28240 [soil metagenome]